MGARDSEATQRSLVSAGIDALGQLTVAGLVSAVGTREIARLAGVSAATLFHHFGSVEAYADALVARVFDPDTSPVSEINDKIDTVQRADLAAQAGMAMHRSEFRRVLDDPEHRLRVGLWAFGGDRARDAYGHYVRVSDGHIVDVTTQLCEAWGREIRPPFDATMFVAAQAALLSGSVIRFHTDPAAMDVDRFALTASALSLVMMRIPGDRLDLSDRLAEINYYSQREVAVAPSERRSRTRERVLETARQLFARDGFAETSIAQVARAAHVSPNTVYRLFESKSDLAVALLLHEADAQWPPGATVRTDLDEDLDARIALRAGLIEMAHFVASRAGYAATYVSQLAIGAQQPGPDPLLHRVEGLLDAAGERTDLAPIVLLVVASRVLTEPAAGADGAVAGLAALVGWTTPTLC